MTAKRITPGKFFDLAGPKDGFVRDLSNQTPLANVAGKIHMHCDNCGASIFKSASKAKRYSRHYCGDGCRHAGSRNTVSKKCVICGVEFYGTKSMMQQLSSCGSKECIASNKARAMDLANNARLGRT